MESEIDFKSHCVSSLSSSARYLLSSLLNPKKLLPSNGPGNEKLLRDWRGLASLVNISSEEASSIKLAPDKTGKILEIWTQRQETKATVGLLLEYLQRIDRFDVYDDLLVLATNRDLVVIPKEIPNAGSNNRQVARIGDIRSDLMTYEDLKCHEPQMYHAFVLYAKEDQDFALDLINRLRAQNFKICVTENLLPQARNTVYSGVSTLISERCHWIILVYSPDFLNSPANAFYMDYAQALSIESKTPKIIPCIYRDHEPMPDHLRYVHKIRVNRPGERAAYDFYEKLSQSLELASIPRIRTTSATTSSSVNITEVQSIPNGTSQQYNSKQYLAIEPQSEPMRSSSMHQLDTLQVLLPAPDTQSVSSLSQISGQKKKKSKVTNLLNILTGKRRKEKKALMVES